MLTFCAGPVSNKLSRLTGECRRDHRRRCEIDHGGAQRRDLTAIFRMHVGRRGVKDEVDRGLVEPSHQTINALGGCFESELTCALNTCRLLDATIQVASNSLRWHFINRSVPILPGPMIAAFALTVIHHPVYTNRQPTLQSSKPSPDIIKCISSPACTGSSGTTEPERSPRQPRAQCRRHRGCWQARQRPSRIALHGTTQAGAQWCTVFSDVNADIGQV